MKKNILYIVIVAVVVLVVILLSSNKGEQGTQGMHMMSDGSLMSHDDMGHMDMAVSSEKDFIEKMIPHHQEAVDTAQQVVERGGATPEVKELVENIIVAQEKEITEMKSWYLAWYGEEYQDTGAYVPMMRDLSDLSGSELDRVFLEDMIMHHMGAVMMAEMVRPYIENEEIENLVQAIAETQTQEIELMMSLLQA